jgi:hypothetical protein
MGIQGLTKYVSERFRGWESVSLANCPIVLDGNSILYHVKKSADLEWRHGGQYNTLQLALERFFNALVSKNIKPIHIVFDGIDLDQRKQRTIVERKRSRLQSTQGSVMSGTSDNRILPPLISEVFRHVILSYKDKGDVIVYTANDEADDKAVTIANENGCYLVGDDSDFYVHNLHIGYIPLTQFTWREPGDPVECKVFKRDVFAAGLGIPSEVVVAIPAIVGNDVVRSIVDATSLKYSLRSGYRGRNIDVDIVINLMRNRLLSSFAKIEDYLQSQRDGTEIVQMFRENLKKCQDIYETPHPYETICPFPTFDNRPIPKWLVDQFKSYQFTKDLLEVLNAGRYLLHIVPEDLDQTSAKSFSRPIRQAIYGIMFWRQDVIEITRENSNLIEEGVSATCNGSISIHSMDSVTKEEKVSFLCSTLLCDVSSLTIDEIWHLPIASVCYWAKTADISRDDVRLKALLLSFVKCYNNEQSPQDCEPTFDINKLHLYTQWQCTFYDAILLNQVLALPLPTLSPASVFDGRCVTFFSQQPTSSFDLFLPGCSDETQSLYGQILHIVQANLQ